MITNCEKARALRQKQTPAEQCLWQALRNRQLSGYKFHRQFVIGQYIVDFVCRSEKLIVELDGLHHAEENQVEYDQIRTAFLVAQDYRVLRFWNTEVETAMPIVQAKIIAALLAPLPPGEGLG